MKPPCRFLFIGCMVFALNQSLPNGIGLKPSPYRVNQNPRKVIHVLYHTHLLYWPKHRQFWRENDSPSIYGSRKIEKKDKNAFQRSVNDNVALSNFHFDLWNNPEFLTKAKLNHQHSSKNINYILLGFALFEWGYLNTTWNRVKKEGVWMGLI